MICTIGDLKIGQTVLTPRNRRAKVLKLIKARSAHRKKEDADHFERVLLQYLDDNEPILEVKGASQYGATRVILQPKLLKEV